MEQQPINSSRNDTKRRPRRESQRRCGPSLWSIFIVTCVIFCTVMFRMSWELTTNNNNSNSIDGTSSNNKLSMLNNFAGTVRPAKVVLAKDAKEDSLRKSTLKQSILDAKIESERQLTLDNKNNDNHHGSEPPPLNRLIDRSIRVEVPDKERTLAFVHIGKSGGSTISLLLRNGCMTSVDGIACEEHRWEKFPGPAGETETIASQRIQFYREYAIIYIEILMPLFILFLFLANHLIFFYIWYCIVLSIILIPPYLHSLTHDHHSSFSTHSPCRKWQTGRILQSHHFRSRRSTRSARTLRFRIFMPSSQKH